MTEFDDEMPLLAAEMPWGFFFDKIKSIECIILAFNACANIRQFKFDNEIYDENGSYDPTTWEFTSPRDGYYQFNFNILLKSYNTTATTDKMRIGVSQPYDAGTVPSSTGNWDNQTFAILNQNTFTSNTSIPQYMSVTGVQYVPKGKKVRFLTRYITPGITAGTEIYSCDVDAINYKREKTNVVTIMYYPTN